MKFIRFKCVFFLLFCSVLMINSQNITQPKIMIIPFATETEDIRTILEEDPNKRIILTRIKDSFDNRGVSTVDFLAKLKAIKNGNILNEDNKKDVKSLIVDMSGADLYVEAEMLYNTSSTGNEVKIIMTAYEASGGHSLANKVSSSGKFYTNDVGALALRAINAVVDEFLDIMQQKFTSIAENGRSVMLQIGFDENSDYTMETEIEEEGYVLQDLIELWLEEMAYQGDYHMQGVTPLKMIVDDIKLPLSDDEGKNYTVSKFSLDLFKKMKSVGIPITRTVRGNTLYITIK